VVPFAKRTEMLASAAADETKRFKLIRELPGASDGYPRVRLYFKLQAKY